MKRFLVGLNVVLLVCAGLPEGHSQTFTPGQVLTAGELNTAFALANANASAVQAASLQKTNNLSDLNNAATARNNLGLGTAATQPYSAFDVNGAATAAIAGQMPGNALTATYAVGAGTASNVPYSGLTGSVPTWNQNTTGTAAAASALAATPANCGAGNYATGINAAGSAVGCASAAGAYQLPAATSTVLGGTKPDGTTITNNAGAISVTYGTTAGTAAQGNDSRIVSAVQSGGALGTPSSGTATNLTGTAAGLTSGNTSNVSGQTAAAVAAAAVMVQSATASNVPSTIVMRDASGNMAASGLSLAGSAVTACTAQSGVVTYVNGYSDAVTGIKTIVTSNSTTPVIDGQWVNQSAVPISITGTSAGTSALTTTSSSTNNNFLIPFAGTSAGTNSVGVNSAIWYNPASKVLGSTTALGSYSVTQTFSETSVGVGIASSGVVSNVTGNAVVTFTTPVPAPYNAGGVGLYLYYPANSIISGQTAAQYWTVFSSATSAVVYNNTYASQTTDPVPPASPTAFGTFTPTLVSTGSTSSVIVHISQLPGNWLGKNGYVEVYPFVIANSTGNNKTMGISFGSSGNSIFNQSTSTFTNWLTYAAFSNFNSTSQQIAGNPTGGAGFGAATGTNPALFSVDTTTAQNVQIVLQNSVATDWLILARVIMRITP